MIKEKMSLNIEGRREEKRKSWNPLSFMKPAKPKEETAVSEAPKKTSGWNIFGVKKQSGSKVASATETPKAKAWTPLSFNKTAKISNKMVVAEAKKEDKSLAPAAAPEEKAPAPASETVLEVKAPEPEAKSVEAEKPIVNDAGAVIKTEEAPPKGEAVTTAVCPAPADLRSPEPVGVPKTGDNPDDQIEKDEY